MDNISEYPSEEAELSEENKILNSLMVILQNDQIISLLELVH